MFNILNCIFTKSYKPFRGVVQKCPDGIDYGMMPMTIDRLLNHLQ